MIHRTNPLIGVRYVPKILHKADLFNDKNIMVKRLDVEFDKTKRNYLIRHAKTEDTRSFCSE